MIGYNSAPNIIQIYLLKPNPRSLHNQVAALEMR